MSPQTENLTATALILAPSLRDKWDFSDDSQYDKWAEMSYKAAESFIKKEKSYMASDALLKKSAGLAKETAK